MAQKRKSAMATPSRPSAAVIKAAVARLIANYRLGQPLTRGTTPDPAELQQDAAKYPGGSAIPTCERCSSLQAR